MQNIQTKINKLLLALSMKGDCIQNQHSAILFREAGEDMHKVDIMGRAPKQRRRSIL